VIGHDRGSGEEEGWTAVRAEGEASADADTEDAEACSRWEGAVYVVGSQFGRKEGPLQPKRSFMARVGEDDLVRALDGEQVPIELAPLEFGLHRAINDALARAGVDLLPLGAASRRAYIEGAASERVRPSDHPVNVEAAEFRPDGRLLLGLRYPVTRHGQPILVELDEPAAVLADPSAVPGCSGVWVLGVGSPERPMGLRALHREGSGRFHAIVGNLDSGGKSATVLEDHPEGADAESTHVRFTLPVQHAGGEVGCEVLHVFDGVRRVEGVALGPGSRAHYVIDHDGRVDLRTLVLGDDER
jgi:hypothetical protein